MLKIGSVLDGKYKILSEIGHGGMSIVYMALNEKANKTWAVKEIRKNGKLDFNVVRQGLVSEIETLKRLKHPALPSIVDVIEDADTFIIVMDYIEGNSLDKSLKESGAQSQEDVIDWAKQLCNVLGYLHSCNPPIIYRDMKPANIMLKPNGDISLIDFGTAKTFEVNAGETTGIGTIGYAAPEQYIGSGYGRTDARTDIYCLGITMYQLLTNIDPCKNVISNKSVRAVNPAISQGLDDIIVKCTAQDPKDRYQSCEELFYALDHYNEVGEAYRKKQIGKLVKFSVSAILTILFAVTSVFGYISAQKKDTEDYNSYMNLASDATLSKDERVNYLYEAIKLDPEDSDAYTEMVKLFLSSNEGDTWVLDKTEAENFTKLSMGIQSGNKLIKPIEILQEENPDGYILVCNKIGTAYWSFYEVESERYISGSKWFKKIATKGSLAQTYVDIAEGREEVKELKGQNLIPEMYGEYSNLWGSIKDLYDLLENYDDDEDILVKITILKEVTSCISSNAVAFRKASVPQESINKVLNGAKSQVETLYETTVFDEYKTTLESLSKQIDDAILRTDSVNVAEEVEQ